MCGITGVVGRYDPAAIEAMTGLLAHRGPDDSGTWLDKSENGTVMLGSRRLAILDLSEAGHMPMASRDGRYVITYNGEVYNYIEVRKELEAKGHEFRSGNDTDVILTAYQEWGTACLQKFNGMFAIAIWDRQLHRLFLARDRLGVKPLYYSLRGRQLYFASEIKSFFGDPTFEAGINAAAVGRFLSLQYVPWPDTAFAGVCKLPPAHFAVFENGTLVTQRYWSGPEAATKRHTPLPDELMDLFADSVRLRLRSDVPVGLFLSGGIDSSLVAQVTSMETPSLSAFTVGFDAGGERYDERVLARETADRLELHHQVVNCTEEEFCDLLPTLVWYLDEPVGENLMLPFFRLSQSARREFTVALSGEGADEAFYGYRYYTLERIRQYGRYLGTGAAGQWLAPHLRRRDYADNIRLRSLMYLMSEGAEEAFWSWSTAFFTREQLDAILDRQMSDTPSLLHAMAEQAGVAGAPSSLDVCPYMDLHFRLVDYLLTVRDKMTMAASLELRCPFLDYRVVEAGLATPARDKLTVRQTKTSLRHAAAALLPNSVSKRTKRPFSSPVPFWLNGLVERYLRESKCVRDGILRADGIEPWLKFDDHGRCEHPHKVFNLLVLEIWYRLFITRCLTPSPISNTIDNQAVRLWSECISAR